ncbi:MAG: permease [Gemmatimonadetes bacterium]|nr:permease [Gemmatimonadota bacterium]
MRLARQDLRLAVRSFTRHRSFTAVAVLSLGLAIALNATMYSVIDALVNPQIDMQAPERLYRLIIWGDYKGKVDNATRASMLRTGMGLYEGLASSSGGGFNTIGVEHGRRYAQVARSVVSPNLFAVLGVHAMAGRLFSDADFVGGAQPVVISDRLAGTLFPDDESPVGVPISIDGTKHVVLGVLGRGANFPGDHVDVWTLPPPTTQLSAIPSNVVRLRKGIAKADAERALSVLSARMAMLSGESPKDVRIQLKPSVEGQFHYVRFHYALIGAVVAVLLIACANLANLQLARGIGRSRELALRAALGASRRDIVVQLLVESAVLAGVGLALGLLLTFWGTHVLESRIPPSVAEYVIAPQTSWRVLVFAMIACVVCVILVGLLPAIHVSRVDPNVLLKAGAGTGANKKNRRQYGVMVVAEIGLSLALLSAAAIVVRTAFQVRQVHVGYDLAPLTDTWVYRPALKDTVVRHVALANEVLSTVRALPNVAEAALYRFRSVVRNAVTVIDDAGASIEIPAPAVGYRIVTPSYFKTFGLPIVKGRDFLDGVPAEPEVIVDKATARALWPNSNPVGARIKLGDFSSTVPWARVVGVVGASERPDGVVGPALTRTPDIRAIYYLPVASDSTRTAARNFVYQVVTRAKSDPQRMPVEMLASIRQLHPDAYVSSHSMEESLGILRRRQSHDFVASTFMVFAALAVSLAALGIYGIVAHSVAERTRELGVRIALGASARDVVGVILREGNAVALAGVAVGLYLTKNTVAWLHAFSVEGDEYDAPLFAAMALALFLVAVLSALIPALRATRIDPVESLRSE